MSGEKTRLDWEVSQGQLCFLISSITVVKVLIRLKAYFAGYLIDVLKIAFAERSLWWQLFPDLVPAWD